MSVAVASLWTMVLIFSLITSPLIQGIGIIGTFGLFAAITLVGGVYFILYLRSTEGLSSEACKFVYFPDDLKPNSNGFDEVPVSEVEESK